MHRMVAAAAAIEATRGRHAKVQALADLLRELDRERLPIAARWFAGQPFPASEGRVLGVGGRAVVDAIAAVSGADEVMVGAAWRRHADPGDVARELLTAAAHAGAGVDILDVMGAFSELAVASGTRARAALLAGLLMRCSPDEARLVVKIITGDMRIGLREGLVEEAVARAFVRDPAAVQRADMVTGDIGTTALLALDDALATATPRAGAPVRFMLATPAADEDEVVRRMGDEVWVEDKYDGIRCQLHRVGDRVVLFSRDLRDITVQFPEVVATAAGIDRDVIVDGELLAMRDGGVLPFQALQNRLGRLKPSTAMLADIPVVLVAWDLLLEHGEPLLDIPLRERRRRLEALADTAAMTLAHQEQASGSEALAQLFLDARARRNEGLIVKDPGSVYSPGRRGLAWLKLKRPLDTLDCVVVGAQWGSGRRRAVLSDVTFAVRDEDTGELVTLGKAYTGLTDAEIATMTEELLADTVDDGGHYRRVQPRIVLEIAFDRVQRSTRHRSGYALRFPRIVRRRDDRTATDVSTLAQVRAIAASLEGERVQRVDAPDATPLRER